MFICGFDLSQPCSSCKAFLSVYVRMRRTNGIPKISSSFNVHTYQNRQFGAPLRLSNRTGSREQRHSCYEPKKTVYMMILYKSSKPLHLFHSEKVGRFFPPSLALAGICFGLNQAAVQHSFSQFPKSGPKGLQWYSICCCRSRLPEHTYIHTYRLRW